MNPLDPISRPWHWQQPIMIQGAVRMEVNFCIATHPAKRFRKADYGESERAKLAEFLIRFHETESPLPHSILEAEFPEKEVVVEELLAIFQDADALDRLRFGYRSEDHLDFNRLRLSESREMILISRILNDQLTDPELIWDMKETAEDNNMEIQEQAR